jgi:hypothetical protein
MDAFIVSCIACHDAEEIVKLAAHQMAFENLGHALNRLLKLLEGFFSLCRQRHFNEELIGKSQRHTIQRCGVARNHTRFFQKLHAAMGGGGGKAGFCSEIID